MILILIFALAISFFFAFWNGFTDAANAISTIIATRVLKPVQAVVLSAIGNFIGMFFGVAVAITIGQGIISPDIISGELLIAALIGALVYDVITWYFGLPVSESHVLIGGLVGAGSAASGLSVINISGIVDKVIIPMITSPIIAIIIAFFFTAFIIRYLLRVHAHRINRYFRVLQIFSSFFFSVTHGTNDAQKVMGIITAMLIYYGFLTTFDVPLWVIVGCHAMISVGTFFGGWRIVKTMAHRITRLKPFQGFSAETSGAMILSTTALLGFPVSTTHVISGSIMGVGATKRLKAVHWGVTRNIVWAWILSIPMAAIFSFFFYKILMFVL